MLMSSVYNVTISFSGGGVWWLRRLNSHCVQVQERLKDFLGGGGNLLHPTAVCITFPSPFPFQDLGVGPFQGWVRLNTIDNRHQGFPRGVRPTPMHPTAQSDVRSRLTNTT